MHEPCSVYKSVKMLLPVSAVLVYTDSYQCVFAHFSYSDVVMRQRLPDQ